MSPASLSPAERPPVPAHPGRDHRRRADDAPAPVTDRSPLLRMARVPSRVTAPPDRRDPTRASRNAERGCPARLGHAHHPSRDTDRMSICRVCSACVQPPRPARAACATALSATCDSVRCGWYEGT